MILTVVIEIKYHSVLLSDPYKSKYNTVKKFNLCEVTLILHLNGKVLSLIIVSYPLLPVVEVQRAV